MADITKKVRKVPDITPELLEKNEAEQVRWREIYTAPHESAESYAERVIKDNLRILDALEATDAKRDEKAQIRAKITQIRDETAVWLSSVGQFEAAIELSTVKEQRDLWRKYIKAVDTDDSTWCSHPTFENVDGQLSQVAYREFDFFSHKHARKVSMIRCSKCGFRNARNLDADLKKLSDHRAMAVKTGNDVPTSLAEIVNG